MQCPICSVDLVMAERQTVEIDYCPKCRGVWLDRGELDTIIERSTAVIQGVAGAFSDRLPGRSSAVESPRGYPDDDRDDDRGFRRERRGGFLSQLFDRDD